MRFLVRPPEREYILSMPAKSSTANPAVPRIPASRSFFRRVRSSILQFDLVYRFSLKLKNGTGRLAPPPLEAGQDAGFPNGVLESRADWQEATRKAKELGLPLHRTPEKNWDHLAAVRAIVNATPQSACILDAGAELYSNVLPALFVYGYRNLYGMNLCFTNVARRGSIRYMPGDITSTGFPSSYFDAITCMSVIEHGVPLKPYFREMYRVMKPGGILVTSTDYYSEPIDTGNKAAFGCPIKIFSRREAEEMIAEAKASGFETTGEIKLESRERPIRWEPVDLDFTYLIFTLRKPAHCLAADFSV